MISKFTFSSLFLAVVLFSSCVSSKKYKAATADAQSAKAANDSLMRQNSALQSQLNDAVSSSKMLAEERDRYQKSSDSARQQLETMQSAVDKYTGTMDEVQKKVSDRMADYAERGVQVTNKNGHVAVNIDD